MLLCNVFQDSISDITNEWKQCPSTCYLSAFRDRVRDGFQTVCTMRYWSYVFSVCGARYKTRPGLSYHLNHAHLKPDVPTSQPETQPPHLECQVADDDKSFTPPPGKIPVPAREGSYHSCVETNPTCAVSVKRHNSRYECLTKHKPGQCSV